jgi:hypothetical protein
MCWNLRSCPLIAVVALLALASSSRCEPDKAAESPAPQAPLRPAGEARWNVIAECQMIVLPQMAALPLLPDLGDDEKIAAILEKLQQMIVRGEATLAGNLSVRGGAGVHLTAQSVEEVRYATEYTPPQLPTTVPKEKAAEFLKNWPHVGITPTAFETRNVGAMLELTATVSEDGQWLAVETTPKHVRLVRFAKFDAGTLASGGRLSVEQPYFSDLSDHLTMDVRSGQWVLVGQHKVPGEDARVNDMELFFLRVRAQHTGETK